MGTLQRIAENYWRAEESRDLDAILTHYRPDAELIVPEMGRLSGRGQIKKFYELSIQRFPGLQVDILRGFENGNEGAFEWRATFTDHAGRPMVLQGVNVFTITEGMFHSVHVYYDPAPLAEALGSMSTNQS